MTQFIAVALLVLIWCAPAQSDDPIYPDHPRDVRVTGTILPTIEQNREDLVTVNIFVQDTPKLLRVGKIEDLTEDQRDRAVREGILIRQVRFYGPDALIQRLLQPEIVGKVVTIEGRFDAQERRFLVKSVTEAPGEEILSPTKK
jgi:hypothetical protein